MTLPRGITTIPEDALLRMAKAVGTGCPLVLYVGEWLSHLRIFSDAQLYDALKFIRPVLEYASKTGIEDEITILLSVVSYRWITINGLSQVWDAVNAEVATTYDYRPVTHVLCDIMALREYMRKQEESFRAFAAEPAKYASTAQTVGAAASSTQASNVSAG